MPTTNLWRFASATFVALVLALAAAGCSSSSALKPDASTGQGGRDAGAGTTGAAGSTGGVGAGAGGGAAGAGAGTAGAGGGAAGAGGAGGAGGALGYCDKDEDCVFHSVCCGGTCNAKTDPAAPPMVCATACAINLGPSTCGCVNHKCSSASTCIVPGSGLCPYCPNGYLKGATGCQTCECASTDAGTNADGAGADASVHSLGEACDDGGGCTSGLVCKAIGDPCPTYPKCNRCYRPCGDGGACPLSQRCIPPAGQGGDVCL